MKIQCEKSIATINNRDVDRYTISNKNNISVSILNYGAIISSIKTPDRNKNFENIVLGFDDVNLYANEDYLKDYPYFGAICGRYAGRIKNGQFSIDDKEYKLTQNTGNHHLHGGVSGFDKKFWNVTVKENHDHICLVMKYRSRKNEENYPGNLNTEITYILYEKNMFSINIKANTDKPTIVNIANHSYFNLTGNQTDISRMQIEVNSELYTPIDEHLIPTGKIESVKDTALDLRSPTTFKEIHENIPGGLDCNFILKDKRTLKEACNLWDQESGRRLKIFTTQPALQVYSGCYVPRIANVGGKFSGVALETQNYSDAPNNKNFPSPILRPGEVYRHKTILIF